MKNLITFILLANSISLNSQPVSSFCYPTMKEIYDFKVGQVFQYNEGCNNCNITKYYFTNENITSKYTIISKLQKGDSLIYHIHGHKKIVNVNVDDVFHPKYDTTITYSLINEDLVYVDSISHDLNKCNGDSINYFFGKGELIISESDSVKNIGIFNYNKEYVPYLKYAKNLGLVENHTPFYAMYGYSSWSKLEGYIYDGVKHGNISADVILTQSTDDKIIIKIIAKNYYEVSSDKVLIGYQIFNFNGQLITQKKSIQSQNTLINLSDLAAGFYIIKVNTADRYKISKVIKLN